MSRTDMLMLYVEPTPYIQGLVDRVRARFPGVVRVVYLGVNRTQNWGLSLDSELDEVLPDVSAGRKKRIKELISDPKLRGIQLAGWGGDRLFLYVILRVFFRGIPTFVESDTPQPPNQPMHRAILKRLIYPVLFSLPTMFLPGGTRQAKYLKSFWVSENRMAIAQMTVDTLSISNYRSRIPKEKRTEIRIRFGLSSDDVVALFVGRLEAHKGVSDLVEAYSRARVAEPQLRLLIVGDGDLRREVDAAAAKMPGIVITGRLSGTAIWDAYSVADFLVVPSRFEPWGLVVNEGMAAGLPVIATDCVGCCDDLVIDGRTGKIIPANAPAALATAMELLASNRQLRNRMSEQSVNLIANWSLEEEANRIIAAWAHVCRQ